MWFGFAVRHIAKKATIAAAVVAGVVLSTRSGRKAAKVILAGAKAAGEAAYNEIRTQHLNDSPRSGLK
jgi:hypothetical protein